MQIHRSACLAVAMLLFTMSLVGCASTPATTQPSLDACQAAMEYGPGEVWIETSLYFGLGSTDGNNVASEQWNDFLDDVVTPRFPDGLTVYAGRGQYTTKFGKLVKENCRVIVILHPPTSKANKAIEEIRETYKSRMHQESVLRVTVPAKVSF
jgi:hypothetical protein